MAVTKKQRTLELIQAAFEKGASAFMVSNRFEISHEEALSIQAQLANALRRESVDQKLILRNMLRAEVPAAVRTLVEIHTDSVIVDGKNVSVLQTKFDLERANVRMRAAAAIIAAAREFMNDSTLELLATEKPPLPEGSDELQPTIFDYHSSVKEDGSSELSITPRRLQIVEATTEEEGKTGS